MMILTKRIGWLLLFALHLAFAFSQTDSTQKKNGYTIFYYDNGKRSSEGNMRNGHPDGYWKTYYKTGILKNEGNRENYLLDSTWKFYNDKGQLTKTILYANGKKNGFSVTYDTTGITLAKEYYIDDVKQDTSYLFYKSGHIKQVLPFKNGRADGLSYIYSEDSIVTNIIRYKMGYVEKHEYINQTDSSGKKQGIWKEFYPDGSLKKEERYKDGAINGYVKEYDKKGNLSDIKKYDYGKEVQNAPELAKLDVFRAYYDDGTVRYEGGYVDGMPMGTHYRFHQSRRCDTVTVYVDTLDIEEKQFRCFNIAIPDSAFVYENGYLLEKGPVDSLRRRQHEWIEYNTGGEFHAKGNYIDDKRIGNWEFFYPNGKIQQKGKFDKKGRKQGPWLWYYDNGNTLMKENYLNDKLDGAYEEYTEDGKLITKGEYLDGDKEGPWYYEILNYKEYGVYHGGMPDSTWKAYYIKENKLRFEGTFLNGDANGKHTYYYSNGKVQATGKYVAGEKDGDWHYFDENGFLVLTVNYENGIERKWDGITIVPTYEDALRVFEDVKEESKPPKTDEPKTKKGKNNNEQ